MTKKIWKKHKFWLSILAYLLLLTAMFLFVIHPLIKEITATADAIQEKIIDNEINQSRIAKIPEMESALQSFSGKENELNVFLDENNEIDFIKQLESLADITGNKIDLKIEESQPKQAVIPKSKEVDDIKNSLPSDKYITVQINLEGGYSELVNFIHKLENFNYYVNIISIDAAKNSPENDAGNNPNPFAGNVAAKKAISGKETIKSAITIVAYLKK